MNRVYHQRIKDGSGISFWNVVIEIDGVVFQRMADSEAHAARLAKLASTALNLDETE